MNEPTADPRAATAHGSAGAPEPARADPWAVLRRDNQARIGLGSAGVALPSRAVLELNSSLAAARDAVHVGLDTGELVAQLAACGIGDPIVLTSRARNRDEYLRRPDLGRVPAELEVLPATGWQLGFVIADGLSSKAIREHAANLVRCLVADLGSDYTIAPPVVVTQARVAVGDWIGQRMGLETVIVLIGERPGLSVADSLGMYLTHCPKPGLSDARRNCISNIHPPQGLGYRAAAATAARLVAGARALGHSGVDLKDSGPDPSLTS